MQPETENRRILLAEDNPDTALLIEYLLETYGTVTTVATAQEAMARAEHDPYDLILLDINLGEGLDGSDVLHHLKATGRNMHVPVGAVTAYAMPGDRDRFLKMGFDAYLSKPFSADDLIGMVEKLLNGPSRR
jgi:CheY-like chemotaxis protein